MRRLLIHICHYERHRKVQLFVTGGTIVGAVVAIAYPEWAHASTLAGVAVNLIWVWE